MTIIFPAEKVNDLLMVNPHIFDIGFEQPLNGHSIAAETDAEISIEVFGRDGLQILDQHLLRSLQSRTLFPKGVPPVLLYKHCIISLPVAVVMGIEGGQPAFDDSFCRVEIRIIPACQMREHVPDRPDAKEDRVAFLA